MKRAIRHVGHLLCTLALLFCFALPAAASDETSYFDCTLFLYGIDAAAENITASSCAIQGDGSGDTWAVASYGVTSGATYYLATDPYDSSVNTVAELIMGDAASGIAVFRLESRIDSRTAPVLRTLDGRNLLSGFAEMVKHALLDSREAWAEVLRFDLERFDLPALKPLLGRNIAIKERIVAQDPTERGLRKALNLGHTFGHAFESLSYRTPHPLPHGYAVMWGLVCEAYLSHVRLGFPASDVQALLRLAKAHYGGFDFTCTQYDELLELMTHDKKNRSQAVNFTLLAAAGDVRIDQTATRDEILECLDYAREG